MTKIRVGEGQTETGKILDRETQWYTVNKETGQDEREAALKYAMETWKNIYVSINNTKYVRVIPETLKRLPL